MLDPKTDANKAIVEEFKQQMSDIVKDIPTGMKADELGDHIESLMKIDVSELGAELERGPKLYNTLKKLHRTESAILRKWMLAEKRMISFRTKFFMGKYKPATIYALVKLPEAGMTNEQVKKEIEIDQFVVSVREARHVAEDKVSTIEEAMKRCSSRGYDIKTLLEWQKFQAGAY